MRICYKMIGRTAELKIIGELDERSANMAREQMDQICSNDEIVRVVIDLSELKFMDSTGVGVLIGRYKKLRSRDVQIFLTKPGDNVDKLLKLTGLYEIMPKLAG